MTALFIGIVVGFLLWVAFQLGKVKGSTEGMEEAFTAGWRAHVLAAELQDETLAEELDALHVEQQRQAGREGRQ